ncbi:acyl-CoA dehydrogenase, C-terminal domain protein [Gordonia sp. NB41Y]|uniref:acyl-CoA dehydrogenase, C-terminal domain protein n=1 Tax=Gordonia sp. NB41Y TaxID=875808 RepID=UPI0002BFA90C|nr:acyl-CoA dehydrogenase, C-terminal domain protein [Gordonia sp. NB41Y]EMP10255.1 hypothetical protein ISGA_4765 [Gordonia sp. NB41Y]WLP88425.1 hypothetical protein Q9K23_12330 [Gordonia sp. NB41Y]
MIVPDIGVGVAYLPRNAPGVLVEDDWDAFGQRATKSGTARFDGVEVDTEYLVFRGGQGPQLLAAAQAAGNQLLMAALELGAAEGILDRLKDFDATLPRFLNSWSVKVATAAASFGTAGRLVTAAVQEGSEGSDQTVSRVVRAHAAVNLAKAATYQLSTSIAEEYLAGGFADLDEPAVDRLWRNARVHTLHDSVTQRIRDVGALVLSGEFTTAGGQLQEISGFGESIELGV